MSEILILSTSAGPRSLRASLGYKIGRKFHLLLPLPPLPTGIRLPARNDHQTIMFESYQNPYVVAHSPEDVRAGFIRKTYAHLAGAVAAFIAIEFLLFQIPGIEQKVFGLLGATPYSWLIVIGAWMFISWIAQKWAHSTTSLGMQYAGLGLFVVAEALIFLPLLLIVSSFAKQPELIAQAGIITGALFAGLTVIAFTTKKDFSFLGGVIKIAGFIAIGLIVASIVIPGGFTLGIWFAAAMVLVAAASILYNTSNIIHHYGTTQYVAASLGLFASVALLFYYVLYILMSLSGRD